MFFCLSFYVQKQAVLFTENEVNEGTYLHTNQVYAGNFRKTKISNFSTTSFLPLFFEFFPYH